MTQHVPLNFSKLNIKGAELFSAIEENNDIKSFSSTSFNKTKSKYNEDQVNKNPLFYPVVEKGDLMKEKKNINPKFTRTEIVN